MQESNDPAQLSRQGDLQLVEGGARMLAPELLITPHGAEASRCLVIGKDGTILAVLAQQDALPLGLPLEHLPRRAVLAGFVNTHSHVFQRRLRGRTHRGYADHDSFWTWREQMYGEANAIGPESLYATALACYREMLGAGYTAVGEFHYVHHRADGTPYEQVTALSQAILAAAHAAGIRLLLLPVAYTRAGFDRPPQPLQRRFCFSDVDAYLRFVDELRGAVHSPDQAIGVAPHSVRAVPTTWLDAIGAYARSNGLRIHVHAAEQTAEMDDTQRHHGCTPIALLAAHGVLGHETTIIHATHATEADCLLLAEANAHVCVCPTTEGDLGDGIAPYASFVAHGIPIAIGSDGQTRIDPFEELRWAEFSGRMRYQRRRVYTPDAASPGSLLLSAGTANGARCLGLPTGSIEPGRWADLIAVDLDHPAVCDPMPEDLCDTLVFGAGSEVLTDVWVGGRRLLHR